MDMRNWPPPAASVASFCFCRHHHCRPIFVILRCIFLFSLCNDGDESDDVGGAASHFNQMSTAFRNKTQQIAQQTAT
jgi:hypothetical protein